MTWKGRQGGAGCRAARSASASAQVPVRADWGDSSRKDQRSGKKITATASLAVASYPKHSSDPQSLLEAASEALIYAKEQGGNRVVVADR